MAFIGRQSQAVGIAERASDDRAATVLIKSQQIAVALLPFTRVGHIQAAAAIEEWVIGTNDLVLAGVSGEESVAAI